METGLREYLLKPKRGRKYKALSLFVLFLPAALLVLIFCYIPMYGIIIAFYDYEPFRGLIGSNWIGLSNFSFFLTSEKFWSVLKNTLILSAMDIIYGFPAPIIFALLINEVNKKAFKRTVQSVSYLPHFLSWVVVAGMMNTILSPDGILNNFLITPFGFDSIYFLTEETLFRGILVIADIWKGMGFSSILYFATIAGVNSELYDAASIDGANRIQQVKHVTMPALVPMIVLMFLLRISNIFSIGFDRVFLLQNPVVTGISDVLSTYIYTLGLVNMKYGLTASIGLVQSILGFALLIGANTISKKLSGLGLY